MKDNGTYAYKRQNKKENKVKKLVKQIHKDRMIMDDLGSWEKQLMDQAHHLPYAYYRYVEQYRKTIDNLWKVELSTYRPQGVNTKA